MARLRQIAAVVGTYVAAFVGGVLGAITLAIFAVWITPIPDGDPEFPGPGDGLVLVVPFGMGAIVGFWGGACLVLFGLHKFSQARAGKKARQISG